MFHMMSQGKFRRMASIRRREGPVGLTRALAHAIRVKLDMIGLELLRLRFGFPLWHARSPDSARAYRKILAKMVNSLHPTCVVEVGCGLGGMLPSIKAPMRVGYDMDPRVIAAARFLHPRSIRFVEGGFERVADKRIDVLIAVNWIHDFPPVQLKAWLDPVVQRTRFLLVDAIHPGTPGYAHHHDFGFLEGFSRSRTVQVDDEPNRSFILWEREGVGGSAPS